jgi:hypothetical protein
MYWIGKLKNLVFALAPRCLSLALQRYKGENGGKRRGDSENQKFNQYI